VRGRWPLGSAAGLLASGALEWVAACGADAFTCGDDQACQGGAAGGTCVEGYCAFPSDVCSSGLQWGDHAGAASGTCVPVGGSDTGEANTSPPDPSEATLSGTTSLDSGPLDETAGPSATDVEFRDDALRGEFGAGTMRGVGWTGDRLALAVDASQGTFTSRVFDGGETVTWQTVQWQPDAPYGKPLPNDGAAEVGYLEGGVDMAANVLLMHFEGEGSWDDGTEVLDASGMASHGHVVSSGPAIPLVPGIFGTAIDDQWENHISIPTATAPALAFGVDDFTWALWVRMDSACTTNHVYMGVDDTESGFDIYPHLWLGCTNDGWLECPGLVTAPRAGGVLRSAHEFPEDGGFYCSQTAIDGDAWHHVAVVKAGHQASTLSIYVDGELEGTSPASFFQPIEYPNEPDFTIGAFSRDTYRAVGVFDEAAVWRRALAAEEVAAIYRRGATSLRVAVRVCQAAECADDPPWGPLVADPPHATAPGLEIPLVGQPVGRYAQYRLELAGDDVAPALRSVVVRGVR
jgi:Concanavalin A-like lectin/glucanases superfamily